MYIPDNEGKACDAVVRLLEKLTGETRKSIRNPEEDGVGPPIDLRLRLGTCEYAIEHTRIEPYEKQIKPAVAFKQINDYITKRFRTRYLDRRITLCMFRSLFASPKQGKSANGY